MKGKALLYLVALAMLWSCSASKTDKTDLYTYRIDHIWINSFTAPCASIGRPECYMTQVADGDLSMDEWTVFYHDVDGFKFEDGYLYQLKVRVDFSDTSSSSKDYIKYTLLEIEQRLRDYSLDLGEHWDITMLEGDSINLPVGQKQPYIKFNTIGEMVIGHSSCNSFSGPYTLDMINKIKIGPIVSTRKMCPDLSIETSLLAQFGQITEYSVKDSILYLKDSNGKVRITGKSI
ncbi:MULTISPECIES: META domain-containing protein [Reichenbachiella]|uniref:META domain-containing protein n=1 Tax=Reichenbachiella TaxID=156993 RepID=UPI000E6C08D3|nr:MULTISPECIES: META domain-containing protein [Reichenbachiella]MBU2913495.1 META domain-containing protein [Reichenbachiella agariperforans]RJE74536.1 hypothetical protein BGP76_15430 [Reichenbachiella sp. MSK19-1]